MVLVRGIPLFVKTTGKVIRVGNPTGTTAKDLLRSARPSQAAVSGTIAFSLTHSVDKKKCINLSKCLKCLQKKRLYSSELQYSFDKLKPKVEENKGFSF